MIEFTSIQRVYISTEIYYLLQSFCRLIFIYFQIKKYIRHTIHKYSFTYRNHRIYKKKK